MTLHHQASVWEGSTLQPQARPSGILVAVTLVCAGICGLVLIAAVLLLRRRTFHLRIPARLESIRWLTTRVGELAREARLNEHAVYQCRLALDEACANIIKHAYANQPSGEIDVCVSVGPGVCTIRLTDFGEPYDPTRVAPPTESSNLDDTRPGGWGLHLMRSVMDDVRYRPSPRGNQLVMIKYRQAG